MEHDKALASLAGMLRRAFKSYGYSFETKMLKGVVRVNINNYHSHWDHKGRLCMGGGMLDAITVMDFTVSTDKLVTCSFNVDWAIFRNRTHDYMSELYTDTLRANGVEPAPILFPMESFKRFTWMYFEYKMYEDSIETAVAESFLFPLTPSCGGKLSDYIKCFLRKLNDAMLAEAHWIASRACPWLAGVAPFPESAKAFLTFNR